MAAIFSEFDSKQILVMGLGSFGGGVGVTRWLADQGATVLATDLSSEDSLSDSLSDLSSYVQNGTVKLHLRQHNEEDFSAADLVVANPAVPKPWENKYLQVAMDAGVPVTTEIRLLIERVLRSHIIAVTGTAGKSTTTAMIHHVLNRIGISSHLGGNIGGSLLPRIADIDDRDWIVLELSSAMLYWLGERIGFSTAEGFSPHVAVMTNLEPNHLDWHGTQEHYEQSKKNIFRYQQAGDHRITLEDLSSGIDLPPLLIPGSHNRLNAQFALTAVEKALGLSATETAQHIADFAGLPHRLQFVAEYDDMQFYNDSKSTTPKATVLAVEAFDNPSQIHLIAGGYDKGIDLTAISDLTSQLAGLYTIGQTGRSIAQQADDSGSVQYCETLAEAYTQARSRMSSGDILLLSPGCASWDQYAHFEKRGEAFINLVRKDQTPDR